MKFYVLLAFLVTACNFPKDPENTFENAQEHQLKIGVTENIPFTNKNEEGKEIDFLKEFGRSEKLETEFIFGSESDLIEKLEKREIAILAGGFEKNTIWVKKAGLSRSYDSIHVFLIPKGENKLLQHLELFIHKNKQP
ncbi:MAG: hypothetical protein ABGW97_12985 [Christiangramia sp.]|uniref:hypothetical protein n=1 Tax=Christiangramia sp. TaxID=1931228 RepID=UPI003242EA71